MTDPAIVASQPPKLLKRSSSSREIDKVFNLNCVPMPGSGDEKPPAAAAGDAEPNSQSNEAYVDQLADTLSKRLQRKKNRLKKRDTQSEVSLIQAENRNPSVILSCASSDENSSEDLPPPPPAGDTKTGSDSSTAAAKGPSDPQLTKAKESVKALLQRKAKTSQSAEAKEGKKKARKPPLAKVPEKEADVEKQPPQTDDEPQSDPATPNASPRPSTAGSFLHAIATAEMVHKLQRNAHERHEREELEDVRAIEVHVSGNYQIKFVPILPVWFAAIAFVLNFLIPGSGTLLSGVGLLTCRSYRTAEVRTKYQPEEQFAVIAAISVSQMVTISFLLIGWFWSIVWAAWLIQLSREHSRMTYRDRVLARRTKGGSVKNAGAAAGTSTGGASSNAAASSSNHTVLHV